MEEDPPVRRTLGRPPGSSRYRETDPQLLDQVADKLLASPSLSTRSTILQVVGGNAPAALRRIQVKFGKRSRDEWLADARRRQEGARRIEEARIQRKREVVHAAYALPARLAEQVGNSQFMRDLLAAQAIWKDSGLLARITTGMQAAWSSPAMREMAEQHRRLQESGFFDQILVFERSAQDALGSRYLGHSPE